MGPWLIALVGPLATQLLISLGIGVVTFAGLDVAANALFQSSANAINSMNSQAAQVFGLAGGFQALSIVAGGVMFRISMVSLKSFRKL